MEFTVIDKKTGEQAYVEKIALTEEWAKGLCYCDIDGFAVTECGDLIMLDDCGRCEYAPEDRFEVKFTERTCRYECTNRCTWVCTSCGREVDTRHCGYNYCPNCGARVVEADE